MQIWYTDYRDEKTYTDAIVDDVTRLRGISLRQARSVRDRFPEDLRVLVHSRTPPTDFFEAGSFPGVSEKLKKILDLRGVKAEYLPIELVQETAVGPQGMWYGFNVLASIDCLDWERSIYKPKQGYATDISKLVLLEDMTREEPLFRLSRTISSILIAQDDLAKDIIDAGCTGIMFRPISEWKNPSYPIV